MPNPLDALKKAQTIGAGPNEQVRADINQLPVTQSVMPMLPEGALGGLLGWAKGWLPGASKVASGGILGPAVAQAASASASDIFNPATAQKMGQMYEQARPAVEALEKTGLFAGDRTVGGLYGAKPLGELNPEFTASGAENAYNAGKAVVNRAIDPVTAAYNRILAAGGR